MDRLLNEKKVLGNPKNPWLAQKTPLESPYDK